MDDLMGWLGPAYIWLKAVHVIFVLYWVAGLLLLPRYLAYQADEAPGSPEDAKWRPRIARLRKVILTPGIIVVWATGLALATSYGLKGAGWLHAKITLVLLLSAYHGWAVATARRMAAGARPAASRTLRLLNEIPALLVIPIVVLVITKLF